MIDTLLRYYEKAVVKMSVLIYIENSNNKWY